MADNVTLSVGTEDGAVFATDDIGGVQYPITKITYGALDSQTIASSGAGAVNAGVARTTLASDDPAVALLGTIDTDTGTIAGDTTSIDAKLVSGTVIGEVEIGAATFAAGDLAKKVSEVAGATDVGIGALAIRNDSLADLAGTDGDYAPLQVSSTGALYVTGGGGGTEYTEDVATANPIVGSAVLIERDDVITTAVTEGDWMGLKGSAEGSLWVQDFNSDASLALLGTMDTDTGVIAGAVSAGQMQVDIVADGAGLLTTTAHDAAFGTAGSADAQVRTIQVLLA